MGNWKSVNITGSCDPKDVAALKAALYAGKDYENCHSLCCYDSHSLCGLGDWSGERISAIGNLSERDYSTDDVAEDCKKLVAAAPSLKLKIHCGGEYESKTCVATITVADGKVTIGEPEMKELFDIPTAQIQGNLLRAIYGQ